MNHLLLSDSISCRFHFTVFIHSSENLCLPLGILLHDLNIYNEESSLRARTLNSKQKMCLIYVLDVTLKALVNICIYVIIETILIYVSGRNYHIMCNIGMYIELDFLYFLPKPTNSKFFLHFHFFGRTWVRPPSSDIKRLNHCFHTKVQNSRIAESNAAIRIRQNKLLIASLFGHFYFDKCGVCILSWRIVKI